MNKNKELVILQSLVKTADIHASRLAEALKYLKPLFPLTSDAMEKISINDLAFLDFMTGRFAKLQDLIGGRIFPLILELMQENIESLSGLDRLHKLEKLGIIEHTQNWIEMRSIRNMVTHEYPDQYDVVCKNLQQIKEHAEILLVDWYALREKIAEIRKSLKK